MNYQEIREYLFKEAPEEERRIEELEESVSVLQERTFAILETLSAEDRTIIEGCIYTMEELNLHTVVFAYNKGFRKGRENAAKERSLY